MGNFVLRYKAAPSPFGMGFVNRNVYIVLVTISMLMVTETRNDTAVRISKWLDKAVEGYISNRKTKVKFPSKRNFVDTAVMQLLEKKGVNLSKG